MRGFLAALVLCTVAACGSGGAAAEGVALYEPQGSGGDAALLEGDLPMRVAASTSMDRTGFSSYRSFPQVRSRRLKTP